MDALERISALAQLTEADPAMTAYRNSQRERERIRDLFRLVPGEGQTALDIGARDGFLSRMLAERYAAVTALDLELPQFDHPGVTCVQGDVTRLQFPDQTFDLVLCAEVLEHIPTHQLRRACAELSRVTAKLLVIGVPYDQDIRVDRTTCRTCGGHNPPWGHVNSFNELNLEMLFPELKVEKIAFVGEHRDRTNAVSAWLTDLAGNPYGTYDQDEGCIHCSAKLVPPAHRTLLQRGAGKLGDRLRRAQQVFLSPRPNWIHVLYSRPTA